MLPKSGVNVIIDLVHNLVYNNRQRIRKISAVKTNIMPTTVNIHEAKTHLSKLLHRVMAGEEIIIAKAGQPVARLIPFAQEPERRTPGSARGKISMADDFDAPLPNEILDAFEGNS